ncbi:MAG: hypothetical protein ACRDFB_05525 [Rhabdochlamydiaceae bacterium]
MKTLFFLMFFFLQAIATFAQSDRDPTPKEKIAINKAVQVVVPLIQQFADNNWQMMSGGPDAPEDYSVQKKPDVPIGVAPFNGWQFSVKQGSDLWNTLITPYLTKLQTPPADMNNKKAMADYEKLDGEYKNIKDVYVEIIVNEKKLPINPVKNGKDDLKLPGCYYAYKQSSDPNKLVGTDRGLENSYVLAFGNWTNAKVSYYSDVPYYNFHFLRPPGTPYIENMVIIISGNNNRIKYLLQEIDWNKVNRGLTL